MLLKDFNLLTRDVGGSHIGVAIKTHPDVRAKLAELSQLKPALSGAVLFLDWAIIAICIGLSLSVDSWMVYILSVLIIASRQHALLVLMHEGAHVRLHANNVINDLLSDYLAAFPLLIDTAAYRKHHQAHHRHLNTDNDPDWVRKARLPAWQFPKPAGHLYIELVKNFVRSTQEWILIAWLFSIKPMWNGRDDRAAWARKIGYFATVAAIIGFCGVWQEFLFYWCVPLFFLFPWMQRIRSISEHFGLPRTTELNESRNVKAYWYESFLFGPHNVNFHLTHHLFPSVPFYGLARLTQTLERVEAFAKHAHQNDSYLLPTGRSVLKDLIGPITVPDRTQKAS